MFSQMKMNDLNMVFKGLLRMEVDKREMSVVYGIECDSDEEVLEDESDAEYFSDEGEQREVIQYDLETMFEIVKKRDFHKWSLESIQSRYRKMHLGDSGRKQLSRYYFYNLYVKLYGL